MEKKQIKININSELPSHILHLIFSKLPVFNLPSCRIVCKAWNNLILNTCKFHNSELFFSQIPLYKNQCHCMNFDAKVLNGITIIVASFNFHPDSHRMGRIQIATSCNGLLCIVNHRLSQTHHAALLNPMTNEYVKLPNGFSSRDYYYGFGFSPKTKQCKIVRHSVIRSPMPSSVVEIFVFGTSGGNQWTRVASGNFVMEHHGVYFDGAIYFCGSHPEWNDDDPRSKGIWRLNVEDEKFDEICYPPIKFGEVDNSCDRCAVVNGRLYLSLFAVRNSTYNVWKMEEDGLWIKTYVVCIPMFWPSSNIKFFKFCGDGRIMFLVQSDFILYDPKTRKLSRFDSRVREGLNLFQFDSFNFHSLHDILAGDEA